MTKPSLNERGISVMSIIAAMAIFAIACLSLTQIVFRATRGGVSQKNAPIAENLARERLGEILNAPYEGITSDNFPSEAQGMVKGGTPSFRRFSRTVSIADSVAAGRSVRKEITVVVEWQERGETRSAAARSGVDSPFQY